MLEKVECSQINFDIWPPNIFFDHQKGDLNLFLIDPERYLWEDRIADFVCLEFMNMSLDQKNSTIEADNRVSAEPVTVGTEENIRFAITLSYLGLIIEVEIYTCYRLLHYGYWCNIMAANMLLSNCFKQLEGLTSKG